MFFQIVRMVQYLVLPPAGLLIMMLVGFLLIRKFKWTGRILVAVSFCCLYGVGITPVAEGLLAPLERAHPPLISVDKVEADAIVILGGGIHNAAWAGIKPEPAAMERIVHGVELYHRLKLPLVIAGGSGLRDSAATPESEAMMRTAVALQVPIGQIRTEGQSRNTVENAREVRAMLTSDRIILVTSAYHMKRATAIFKKQGFKVIPAPTGFRTEQRPLTFLSWVPTVGNMHGTTVATSEYLSYMLYSVKGDI